MNFLNVGSFIVWVMMVVAAGAEELKPVDLRANGQVDPLAVSAVPELSWRVEAESRNRVQTAWQIMVASEKASLENDQADVWDSGKTSAMRVPRVTYGGKPLVSGERYFWKVRSWDAADEVSDWSAVAVMEVAPLKPGDWRGAVWIDDGKANPERDEDFYKADPAPLMRRELVIEKPIARARWHVVGLGLGMPSVNGEALVDHVFDPAWTAFDQRVLFRTHDVTDRLVVGRNCLGLSLGNGWYNPLPLRMWGHRNIREALPTGRPRGIACLVVEHPDGSETVVTTDGSWKTHEGPTIKNSIYLGEERDARRAIPGWDRVGFDDSEWHSVRVTDDSLELLTPLVMQPVKVGEPMSVKSITSPEEGVYVVDFGRNFTGVPEIELDVPEGTQVRLRFGELLHDDGSLNPMTSVAGQIKGMRKTKDGKKVPKGGPGAPEVAWQRGHYVARGDGPETFRPRFTFYAFRYMEITGLPSAPVPESIRGIPYFSGLDEAGSFESSNELLNRIQAMTRQTFLSNVMTVQSDCPHRERFAYGGDIVASSEAFLMNYDMHRFYAKTVRDWSDAAFPDGRFTDTAPFVGIDYCGVGWSMTHPLLLEQLYTHYGDEGLIREEFPAAVKWFDGEIERRKDGLVTSGLGDHEALKRIAGPVLTTTYFIETARRLARLARVIGEEAEAKRFEAVAKESVTAWSEAFYDKESGMVGEGSQSELVIALGSGTASAAQQPKIMQRLIEALMEGDDGPRLTTGIYGTRMLPEQLSRAGRTDLAYALATRKTFPSWGYMLENGATTLWEHWAFSDNTFSHNHPMFGSISAWFIRWLGGIQPAEDAVGFDRIVVRPQVVGDLKWVKSSYRSVRGMIRSDWRVVDDGVIYEIEIPANATAVIELPLEKGEQVKESGKALNEVEGLEVLSDAADDGVVRLRVGSGKYQFKKSR